MTTNQTPVAKSLHTVTVIMQVAKLHQSQAAIGGTAESAIDSAMQTLGLAGRPDPYSLRDKALKLYTKTAK